jgi:hypothetical protein
MEVQLNNFDPDAVTIFIHALICALVGIAGAAFGSVDQKINIKQMLWHMGIAAFLCGLLCYSQHAVWPTLSWYICLLPSFLVGFIVYGIAVGMKRSNKTVEGVDFVDVIRKKFIKEDKP